MTSRPGRSESWSSEGMASCASITRTPKTAQAIRDGWLYTGDYVKTDKGGFIWFVDRKKDVIICGGENVYPIEVEEALQAHPFIHDVGVISLHDDRLGETIVAIIKTRPDVEASPETEKAVFEYCEKHLPRYKRPTRIIFDTVMRNPTGKIEKLKMRQKYVEQLVQNG
jgi:long-chain acyl-CoA synthetase